MITWTHFVWFAIPAVLLWVVGAFFAWKEKALLARVVTAVGLAVFFAFIVAIWVSLERPPLRTMGETRLWYSFFLPLAGLVVYVRWRYKWILFFSTLMAFVFICVNLFKLFPIFFINSLIRIYLGICKKVVTTLINSKTLKFRI